MPDHGLLSCYIELGESNTPLREYDTKYANKTVETYVAIPSQSTPFGIRLNTKGYIAPGLAVYVFIDGIYQANRNKRGIKQPTLDDPNAADFQVRMGKKEDLLKDGRVIARGWWFEKLNIVPADTKATINEDVLNNIGTIEVVVLRCQDDPKHAPINPFEFPKLPVLVKAVPAVSNTKSSSRQDRKAASRKSKAKEPSDDGSTGGMFAIFDGAGDDPVGLDGHYDTREYPSHRVDDRPRRHSDRHRRHESPRRTQNPRQRILEEESPKTVTTDEEYQPRSRAERLVHFESPLAFHSRKPPSDSIRRPSGSQYSRHSRDESHHHLLRRGSPDPERDLPRELLRPKYFDSRDPYPDRDERRRNSPVRTRHVSDGRDGHYREQRRSGDSIYERGWSRSSIGRRGRAGNFEEASRRNGSSVRSRDSSEDRGRNRVYHRRGRRGSSGSIRACSWSWSSREERGRSRDHDKRGRHRKRSIEESGSDLRAVAASLIQHVPLATEQGSRRSKEHPKFSPSPNITSDDYPDQHRSSSVRKSSKSHTSQNHNTSPAVPRAMPATENRQSSQQAGPGYHPSNGVVSFFEDNAEASQQTNIATRLQAHRESTAEFGAPVYSSNHAQNSAANQYGFGPIPANHGYDMIQPARPNSFSNQPTIRGQMESGQQTGNGQWPVNNHAQQPMQDYPEAQAFRPAHAQPQFPQTHFPQVPQTGQFPLQANRNMSGPFNHQIPSQYEETGQAAPTQGKMPNHVHRPSPAPVPAAENPQSLISIIQQLKDLGVISIPGQGNNPRGRKKTTSGHRQTCPQNVDRPGNPTCLKHGVHAQSAQQHFATWLAGGNSDPTQGKEWFQHLASEHIACTCEPHQKPAPCTCRPGGGDQGSGSGSKLDKRPDDLDDKKDNNDKQGDNIEWGNENQDSNGQNSSSLDDWGKTDAENNNTWGNNDQTSGDTQAEWKTDTNPTGNANNNESGWNADTTAPGNGNSGGSQQNNNTGSNNNNDSKSKKDKSGSSKSKSKSKRTSTAKEGAEAAPAHEKPYTRSYWKGNETIADLANSSKKRGQHYTMPEDPIYTLSESKAKEFNVRHQVRGGMGLEEKKKTHRPLYLDSFDEPYAVFRFKYRSRDMLQKILGENIKESPEEFQEWLGALSKEQLIAEMLRKKESGAWKSDDGSGDGSGAGSNEEDKAKQFGDKSGGDNTSWETGDAANGGASGGWGDNNAATWGETAATSGAVVATGSW